MDHIHVATTLRELLLHIRRNAYGVPDDKNRHAIASFIMIPHPDSAMVQESEPVDLAAYYYGQVMDLNAYCANCEPTSLSDWVLRVTEGVENWSERGIIGDMPPLHTQPNKPEENLVVEPAKTSGDEMRAWRVECFRDLKFTEKEAEALADALTVDVIKDKAGMPRRYESPLHHSRAKKMLDAGVNHKQIVNLLS